MASENTSRTLFNFAQIFDVFDKNGQGCLMLASMV